MRSFAKSAAATTSGFATTGGEDGAEFGGVEGFVVGEVVGGADDVGAGAGFCTGGVDETGCEDAGLEFDPVAGITGVLGLTGPRVAGVFAKFLLSGATPAFVAPIVGVEFPTACLPDGV